jgi:type I restriction-modification system DNA methylase subunit
MATENSSFEAALFKTADKLRKNIDAAEYKNVVLGLIFLKYISDSFQELHDRLAQDAYSDPEDRDEYIAENVFFVPKEARWHSLQARAKLPTIGVDIDAAMSAIEKENRELRNVLPKVFGKPNLDKAALGQLIDLISDIELKAANGSTFLEISKTAFRGIACAIPEKKILEEFDKLVTPTFDKLLLNLEQIQVLAKTRDTLLPKLMSGAVRVPVV